MSLFSSIIKVIASFAGVIIFGALFGAGFLVGNVITVDILTKHFGVGVAAEEAK